MKYLKIFESFDDTNKYLIELTSANSNRVDRESTDSVRIDAEKWWSMNGNVYELDIPSKYLNKFNNEELTKRIAGKVDKIKFGRDIEGFLEGEKFSFKEKADRDKTSYINQFLKHFKTLKIDQKLEFYEIIEEYGFLIVRGSYIYKVVDKSDIDRFVDTIRDILLSASDHNI
jgi:hypothetical protein